MSDTPTTPKAVIERWVTVLLRELAAETRGATTARVTGVVGGMACLVQVWPADEMMPTAKAERKNPVARREQCRQDVLAAVAKAGMPLTRKEIVRTLRESDTLHGSGTVAKALAELTAAGALVNTRDKKGYRLPSWVRPHPSLFPAE